MSDTHSFSDEQLVAYLDGERDFAPIEEIEAALEIDPQLTKRLEALQFSSDDLRDGYKSLLAHAPTPDFLKSEFIKPASSVKAPLIALGPWQSIAACFLLAFGIGWFSWGASHPSGPQNWRDYVAAYQALYSTDTLAHIAPSDDEKRNGLMRVSKVLGKDLSFEVISGADRMDFKRAQVLGYQKQPLIQLAYLSANKVPMALCIIRAKGQANSAITYGTEEGLRSAYWVKDGFEYYLIGGNDEALVAKAATRFSKGL